MLKPTAWEWKLSTLNTLLRRVWNRWASQFWNVGEVVIIRIGPLSPKFTSFKWHILILWTIQLFCLNWSLNLNFKFELKLSIACLKFYVNYSFKEVGEIGHVASLTCQVRPAPESLRVNLSTRETVWQALSSWVNPGLLPTYCPAPTGTTKCESTTSERSIIFSFCMSLSTRKWPGNRHATDIRWGIDIVSMSLYFLVSVGNGHASHRMDRGRWRGAPYSHRRALLC